ncbi:MAG: RloB family protein [Treponema sp.]|nr:RloB family protein [Treponema sp.]
MAEKTTLKYYFSTEGETEKWYLEHLSKLINSMPTATNKVVFHIKVCPPKSYVKRLAVLKEVNVNHFFDVESTEPEYEKRFIAVLDDMNAAENLGKTVTYFPAYTNLTFELWMILHKMDCNGAVDNRKNYLALINRAFKTNYEGLKEYKEEKHFKQILNQITIEDVKCAVVRAEKIMEENKRRSYELNKHHNYSWYKENPSTEVGTVLGKILKECGV